MNILVTTFWSYKDALVQTYTLPYLRIMQKYLPKGSTIYLLTIEQPKWQMTPEEALSTDEALDKEGIVNLRFPYFSYGVWSLLNWLRIVVQLWLLILFKNVKVIHSFCTTSGIAGYLLALTTGKKFLIDSYEPHAESSVENGDWQQNSFRFKFLFTMEKMQSQRANFIVSATEGMRKYAQEKYQTTFKNFFVKPACVNLEKFNKQHRKHPTLLAELGLTDKIICVYAGKFGGIYLDKETFDFFKTAHQYWGDKFRILILTSHSKEEIANFAQQAGIPTSIIQQKFVTHSEIPYYMGLADFGITPVKPVPTKRYCTPIKDGEYWALGLPVVITKNISDDSAIIEQHHIGAVINEFTTDEYRRCIETIDQLLTTHTPEKLYDKVRAVAEQYRSYEIAEKIYQKIYGELL